MPLEGGTNAPEPDIIVAVQILKTFTLSAPAIYFTFYLPPSATVV